MPLDRKPSVAFDKLLTYVGAGGADADSVSTLAARLARLNREVTTDQDERIAGAAGGKTLEALTGELLASIDVDKVEQQAIAMFSLPAGTEPTEAQLDAAESARMQAALKSFLDPKVRKTIQNVWQEVNDLWQVIDEVTGDKLLSAGFDVTAAQGRRRWWPTSASTAPRRRTRSKRSRSCTRSRTGLGYGSSK